MATARIEDIYKKRARVRKRWKGRRIKCANIFLIFGVLSLNLCNNIDQTWFYHSLTFARSLGRCWKPRASPSAFNTYLRTLRMLMNRKSVLIPIVNNYPMTKNKPIYQIRNVNRWKSSVDQKINRFSRELENRWKGEVPPSPFIGLRSEFDKPVYFWLWGGYLLYNAIIVREKQKLSLFSFSARKYAVCHLVYFDSSRSNRSAYNILWNRRYDNAFFCKIQLF